MKFNRLVSDKLSEKAIDQIKGLINKGNLNPGERLPSERDLSSQLGISRGILREALKTLESLGYLNRKPGGGTFIRELSIRNEELPLSDLLKRATYLDYLEVREMFEQKVVELAIERASEKELEELEDLVKLLENSKSTTELVLQFHHKLASTTRNIIMINFMQENYQIHKDFVVTSDVKENELRKKMILQEHLAILNAVKSRNLKEARLAVAAHIGNVRRYIETR